LREGLKSGDQRGSKKEHFWRDFQVRGSLALFSSLYLVLVVEWGIKKYMWLSSLDVVFLFSWFLVCCESFHVVWLLFRTLLIFYNCVHFILRFSCFRILCKPC